MKFKNTLILALIFAALLAYVLIVEVKGGKKKKEAKEKADKVFVLNKEDVEELALRPSNIVIRKDGEKWKITSPIETEADKSSVESIINVFDWAKVEREIVGSGELAAYGLRPAKAQLEIKRKTGSVDTLFLGDKNPTGSYVFARRGGKVEVFLTTTSLLTHAEKKLFDLRDKTILGFQKDEVNRFNLELNHGKLSFTCAKSSGKWSLEHPIKTEADDSKIDQLLNRINYGRAREFVDEAPQDLGSYGLKTPEIRIDLFLGENNARKSLLIGDLKKDKGQYYAWDDSRKPVFLVDSSLVKDLRVKLFDLRNKDVAKFETNQVKLIELEYPEKKFVCQKDTADTWVITHPEKREAKSWKITSLLSTISGLKAEEFIDQPQDLSQYGLDRPEVKVTLKDGETLIATLAFGKEKDKKVYVKNIAKNTVVLVKSDVVKQLTVSLEDIAQEVEKKEAKEESK